MTDKEIFEQAALRGKVVDKDAVEGALSSLPGLYGALKVPPIAALIMTEVLRDKFYAGSRLEQISIGTEVLDLQTILHDVVIDRHYQIVKIDPRRYLHIRKSPRFRSLSCNENAKASKSVQTFDIYVDQTDNFRDLDGRYEFARTLFDDDVEINAVLGPGGTLSLTVSPKVDFN